MFHISFQCKRVIDIVKRILCETHDKIVVVSQWTTFLSIVADFLNRERVHYVELTGKTAIKDRNNIVASFNNTNSPERVSKRRTTKTKESLENLKVKLKTILFFAILGDHWLPTVLA